MYFVYVLRSEKYNIYYIGYTKNLFERLQRHNAGRERFTKKFKPWKMVYKEEFLTRALALKREKEVKSYKSGVAFKRLISGSSSDG